METALGPYGWNSTALGEISFRIAKELAKRFSTSVFTISRILKVYMRSQKFGCTSVMALPPASRRPLGCIEAPLRRTRISLVCVGRREFLEPPRRPVTALWAMRGLAAQ
jgi:hypothetical protein